MTLFLWNLAVYSLQLATLTLVALTATMILRVRLPRFAWRFWQAVLIAAIMLPIVQPRTADLAPTFVATDNTMKLASLQESFAATPTYGVATVVSIILIAGIAVRLGWLVLGLLRVRSLISGAAATDALIPIVNEVNRAVPVKSTMLITDALGGPATVGVWNPVVLLPRSILAMPASVQRAIICHELVHVARRDWLQTIAEEIWCAALWFHPAARTIASRVSLARETVVDEVTIRLTRDRRAYAEALLAFADPPPHVIGVTPFIGRNTLSQRIALIAEEDPMPRRIALTGLVIAIVTSGTLTAAVIERLPMSGAASAAQIYKAGNGVTLPQVVREVKPKYTPAAMQAKIQGSVWLECVVGRDGKVTDIEVTKSLDTEYGLDDEAVAAARQWEFRPGQKDGKPVAVRITLELTFTLKK
jgi:TonB family protein